ncbi:MAG: ABC transporter ATP-binding protein [Thermoanaerobaculia bacterium]
MSAAAAKIRIAGVSKAFRKGTETVDVLSGIHLEVGAGEFVAIVGPSGCGKSTLLNCIAGFEGVTSGTISIDGERVTRPSKKRVFVFQETGIFPWLSVEENIGFGLGHLPSDIRRDTVARYVALVGLDGFERSYPAELSGGMKQRVEFARALAVDSDVLFLDEPFGALDALTRLEMRREIARIWKETEKTCLLVTHDVEEAVVLAGRIAVMTRRPATLAAVLENPLPRPLDSDTPAFRALRDRIFEILGVERRV